METGYRIPSNVEITSSLNNAQEALEETKVEQKVNLTPEGKKIIDITERLVEEAKVLVLEKNPNDAMQQIIKESQKFYQDLQVHRSKWKELHKILDNPQAEFDSKALVQRMESIGQAAKLLSYELVASSEFRQQVWDFFSVLYAVIVDASHIDRVGKPLREAIETLSTPGTTTTEATEKLKEAGQEAVKLSIDVADTEKSVIVLTDEQKRELWDRFKVILNSLSTRERSQRIFKNIFEIMDILYRSFEDVSNKVSVSAEKMQQDKHIQNIMQLSQQLFEAFTRTSLDPLLAQFKVLYSSLVNDEQLRNQIGVLKNWLLSVLENPELLNADTAYDEFYRMIQDLKDSVNRKAELKHVLTVTNEEIRKILVNMEEDPTTLAIQDDIKRLVQTVLLDEKGQLTYKPEILDQLKLILLSSVVSRLRYPLPEVYADDPQSSFAFRMSGMVLNIQDVLPERIIAENYGLAVLNIKDKTLEKSPGSKVSYNQPVVDKAGASVRIKMENINLHVPEADLWFHKKTFPEMEDTGKCSVDIPGRGMDLTFVLKADTSGGGIFSLVKVDCDIHELELTLHDTRHDTIYNMLITLFKGRVKSNIEESISTSMAGVFDTLNKQISRQVETLRSSVPILGSHH